MLILSRKIGEAVVLDEKITVRVIDISKGVVRIGFDAPSDMLILREELEEEVKQANIEATKGTEDLSALKDFSKKLKKEMITRAYAKVNIFLKIVGKRDDYHEILSRFVKVQNLYDELEFVQKSTKEELELHGEFGCALKQNTIYKAYESMCKAGYEKELKDFFACNALHVKKNILSFAGLGGGSSDAATFLHMINNEISLNLSNNELAKIGLEVGADVPFFIYGYDSANVRGIGEVVEEFKEEPLHVETITPNIKCDTGAVYRAFREQYNVDIDLANKMSQMSSLELLNTYDDITLNDLFKASLSIYEDLENYRKKDWFFSGSGSSFFKYIPF